MKSNLLCIYWLVIQKYIPHIKWIKTVKNYYAHSVIAKVSNKYYSILCDEIDYRDKPEKTYKLDYLQKPYKLSTIEKFEKKLGNRLPEDLREYLLKISREIFVKNNLTCKKFIELSYKIVSINSDYDNHDNIDITDNKTHMKILHIDDIFTNSFYMYDKYYGSHRDLDIVTRYYIIINDNEFYGKILFMCFSKEGNFYEKHGEFMDDTVPKKDIIIKSFTDFINVFVIKSLN